jgi:succinylglutamate desuccinylase
MGCWASFAGRDIWVAKVGSRGVNVLMAGNIHGDETTGGQLLQRWMWETCNAPSAAQTKVASSVVAYYMPMYNADG